MNTTIVAVLLAVLILLGLGVWYFTRRKKSERLRQRFGPEYDKTVEQFRSQERAEKELTGREKRLSKYTIVALPAAERSRYQDSWSRLQERFVDQPDNAVRDAHSLVQEVMRKCGYPLTDFEQSAADLSVDHPHVVENYRTASRIAQRSERTAVTTEELRQALVCYRALFQDLLEREPRSTPTREEDDKVESRLRREKGSNTHPNH